MKTCNCRVLRIWSICGDEVGYRCKCGNKHRIVKMTKEQWKKAYSAPISVERDKKLFNMFPRKVWFKDVQGNQECFTPPKELTKKQKSKIEKILNDIAGGKP